MSLPLELIASMREGMKPTGLDRVINSAFPGWGARRMQARATLAIGGAFVGGRMDRAGTANWNPLVQGPDDEVPWWDRNRIIARSADLEKNDPVAGGIIAEMVSSIVGTGLSLHLEPSRRTLGWSEDQTIEWAQDVQERFRLWAENPNECDMGRKRNFYQGQAVALLTVLTRGDAFALLPAVKHPGGIWSTKIQLMEGDRCMTPTGTTETATLRQGVETDEFGAPVRYYFTKKHPGGAYRMAAEDFMPPVEAFDSLGRRRVLHLYHEKRMDMRRGYPILAPVIEQLKQVSRLSEAELMASVVTSMFAVAIKKPGGAAGGAGPFGAPQKDADGNSFSEIGHGTIVELAPGEELDMIAPVRPNGAYDPFYRAIVGQIAMRVQIPPEILLKKFESSYTAARGALLQFWKFIMIERDSFLGSTYCSPIFELWLAEDVASGGTKAPGFFTNPLLRYAYQTCRWIGDNPPILDPLKEVLAGQELINYGFSTHEEQTMRLTGGNWHDNHERLTREVRDRKAAGLIADSPSAGPSIPPGKDEVDPEDLPAPTAPADKRRVSLLQFAMRGTE